MKKEYRNLLLFSVYFVWKQYMTNIRIANIRILLKRYVLFLSIVIQKEKQQQQTYHSRPNIVLHIDRNPNRNAFKSIFLFCLRFSTHFLSLSFSVHQYRPPIKFPSEKILSYFSLSFHFSFVPILHFYKMKKFYHVSFVLSDFLWSSFTFRRILNNCRDSAPKLFNITQFFFLLVPPFYTYFQLDNKIWKIFCDCTIHVLILE